MCKRRSIFSMETFVAITMCHEPVTGYPREHKRSSPGEANQSLPKSLSLDLCLFDWLVGFLTSSSTTRLYLDMIVLRLTSDNLRAATHETELGDHDFCPSWSHYTDTDPTSRSGRSQRESNPGPPQQESSALPTKPPRPPPRPMWPSRIKQRCNFNPITGTHAVGNLKKKFKKQLV